MKKKISVNNEPFELYLSEKKIHERVKQLGKKLNNDYKGKTPIFIGVLNGSFIFFRGSDSRNHDRLRGGFF